MASAPLRRAAATEVPSGALAAVTSSVKTLATLATSLPFLNSYLPQAKDDSAADPAGLVLCARFERLGAGAGAGVHALLGYADGYQIWDVSNEKDVTEVLSRRSSGQRPVRSLRYLEAPRRRRTSAAVGAGGLGGAASGGRVLAVVSLATGTNGDAASTLELVTVGAPTEVGSKYFRGMCRYMCVFVARGGGSNTA